MIWGNHEGVYACTGWSTTPVCPRKQGATHTCIALLLSAPTLPRVELHVNEPPLCYLKSGQLQFTVTVSDDAFKEVAKRSPLANWTKVQVHSAALHFESKSFRGAAEGSIILHVRSDACCEITHPKSPSFHCHPVRLAAPWVRAPCEQRTAVPTQPEPHTDFLFPHHSPFTCPLFDSLSGDSEHRCHSYDPPTRLCTPLAAHKRAPPREALLQSQSDTDDRRSLRPIISTLRCEWRWSYPIRAFKAWAGPSPSPSALLTDNLYIQWRTLTPFTGRCRSNRRGEKLWIRPQPRNWIPPSSQECHCDCTN